MCLISSGCYPRRRCKQGHIFIPVLAVTLCLDQGLGCCVVLISGETEGLVKYNFSSVMINIQFLIG